MIHHDEKDMVAVGSVQQGQEAACSHLSKPGSSGRRGCAQLAFFPRALPHALPGTSAHWMGPVTLEWIFPPQSALSGNALTDIATDVPQDGLAVSSSSHVDSEDDQPVSAGRIHSSRGWATC